MTKFMDEILMTEENKRTCPQSVQFGRLQAWAMSLVCVLLTLFAVASAIRIPHYLATLDYPRLIGVMLFGLLVLAGLVDNICTHLCLWQLQRET